MGIGMVRQMARRLGKGSIAAVTFSLVLISALCAENTGPPATAPPLSPPCKVPDGDIAAPAALPNVTAALQKHATVRILTIGSASTVGVGASSNAKTYPSQLEAILERALKGIDIQIINRGVTGEVAEITADRIMSQVAIEEPVLVLWQLGTNDALSRIAPEEFEATVLETIRWLKDNRIDIVLVGQQYTPRLAHDRSFAAIRGVLQRIATEEKVLYVRRYDAMRFIAQARANLQLMAQDDFHLSDLGYRCMAEHVAHAVIANLFTRPGRIESPGPVRE